MKCRNASIVSDSYSHNVPCAYIRCPFVLNAIYPFSGGHDRYLFGEYQFLLVRQYWNIMFCRLFQCPDQSSQYPLGSHMDTPHDDRRSVFHYHLPRILAHDRHHSVSRRRWYHLSDLTHLLLFLFLRLFEYFLYPVHLTLF